MNLYEQVFHKIFKYNSLLEDHFNASVQLAGQNTAHRIFKCNFQGLPSDFYFNLSRDVGKPKLLRSKSDPPSRAHDRLKNILLSFVSFQKRVTATALSSLIGGSTRLTLTAPIPTRAASSLLS